MAVSQEPFERAAVGLHREILGGGDEATVGTAEKGLPNLFMLGGPIFPLTTPAVLCGYNLSRWLCVPVRGTA